MSSRSAERRLSSIATAWPAALVALPPLLIGLLITCYWVNVPLFDEWQSPGAFFKQVFLNGHFRWRDVMAQHNESRLVVFRLLSLAVASIGGWDTRILMALTWLIAIAILSALGLLLRACLPSSTGRALTLFAMAALLFSTNQWENWLWAIQIIVFIPPLCLVSCLLIQRSNLSFPLKVLCCAGLALISTYSYANGMLCWVLGFPWQNLFNYGAEAGEQTPVSRKTRVTWSVVYAALAGLTLWRYFRNYVKPSHHPSLAYVLDHPREGPHYFLTWVGSSFAHGTTNAPTSQALVLGLLFVVLLLVLGLLAWRKRDWLFRHDQWRTVYPWIIIAGYGLACGLLTTAGRLGIGVEQALASRYIAFSCYAWIGVVGALVVLDQPQVGQIRPRLFGGVPGSLLFGLFFTCYLFDWIENTRSMRGHWAEERNMALTVRFLPLIPDNPLLSHLLVDAKTVRDTAVPLMGKNVLRLSPAGDWIRQSIERPTQEKAGAFSSTRQGTNLDVNGWAILTSLKKVPDAVLVAACANDGKPQLLTVIAPSSPRPDLPQALARQAYLNCGFVVSLTAERVGQRRLCLYALDFASQTAYSIEDASVAAAP